MIARMYGIGILSEGNKIWKKKLFKKFSHNNSFLCSNQKMHWHLPWHSFLPGWNRERLPSVWPNTTFPFLLGCHLNRQISDIKLWASLCTTTPLSGPENVQIYNGPLCEANATASPTFQHQLRDAGIPET